MYSILVSWFLGLESGLTIAALGADAALALSIVVPVMVIIMVFVLVIIVVPVMVIVMVPVVVIVVVPVVVIIMVPVVVVVVVSYMRLVVILRDTRLTQRNQRRRLLPFTDTLSLLRVLVVLVIALLGNSHDWTADVPAASRDVVLVEGLGQGQVARQQEAGDGQELLDTHFAVAGV